jgi:hypothetical protein
MSRHKTRPFTTLTDLYGGSALLDSLKEKFALLDNLNQKLKQFIPNNLVNLCHIGAIEERRNLLVIFVTDQQALYLLKSMSNHILQSFVQCGFDFDGILLKVQLYKSQSSISQAGNTVDETEANITYKRLSSATKVRLAKLAQAIGKPELLVDFVPPEDEEIL